MQKRDQRFQPYGSGDVRMAAVSWVTLVHREKAPDLTKPLDHPDNRPSEKVVLAGYILVRRGEPATGPDGRTAIPQEVLDADGIGFSKFLGGRVRLIQDPERRSLGKTIQRTPGVDFPADSYFNIHFQITALDVPGSPVLRTRDRVNIASAEIQAIPPIGASFDHNYKDKPVALVDDTGKVHAWLVEGNKMPTTLLEDRPVSEWKSSWGKVIPGRRLTLNDVEQTC